MTAETAAHVVAPDVARRISPPQPSVDTSFFWSSGADGVLRILRCSDCGRYAHPPTPRCRDCGSSSVTPSPVSGRGTLFSYTVNMQAFIPWLRPPYVIALVRLDEQDDLQLTTRLVDVDPDTVHIGMAVRVVFEAHDGVYLPLFTADEGAVAGTRDVPAAAGREFPRHSQAGRPSPPAGLPAAPKSRRRPEDDVVISGVGMTALGRRLGRSDLDLTVEACEKALAGAGLRVADIDGLVAWPGEWPQSPGFCGPGVGRVKDALGLELSWHMAAQDGPGQIAAVMSAVMAVASGYARHVLVYRTTSEATGQLGGARSTMRPDDVTGVTGLQEWVRPFGAVSPANWLALVAQRYYHESGATREQMGGLAVSSRRWAGMNPNAVFRTPITLEDYLSARMISTPLCLLDCDVPADGSAAVVVSAAETAPDLIRPVRLAAMGSGLQVRPYWDQWRHPLDLPAADAARHLWSRTDLRPADVDVAELYDGFSILTCIWLEALGFCGQGEAAAFVAGGHRIGPGGLLPLNTGGGQMSGGRMHGFSLLHEAVTQLQGRGGERQVPGAEVAVVAAGGGPLGGALLLTG